MQKCLVAGILILASMMLLNGRAANAEYGDVVLNNYSEAAGVSPVVFPHWFHRVRYACKVCHTDIGFKFKAGSSMIKMADIMDGQYCGSCHDGEIAWGNDNCELCHSAKPGVKTSIQRSQLQQLLELKKPPEAPENKR